MARYGTIVRSLVSLAACLIAAVVYVAFPTIYRAVVVQQVAIGRDTSTGRLGWAGTLWSNPPYAEYMRFYMFHWSNPWAVVFNYAGANSSSPVKPAVHQMGPYVYRQRDRKHNITFNADFSTVSYKNYRTWTFDAALSCRDCRPDDVLTAANSVYLAAAPLLSSMLTLSKEVTVRHASAGHATVRVDVDLAGVLLLLLGEYPFRHVEVEKVLFTGYDDPLLALNHVLPPALKQTAPGFYPKMAYFYHYNASDDGDYAISTGRAEPAALGEIARWRGEAELPANWWRGAHAAAINGSDVGQMQRPFISKEYRPNVFLSYWCRSIALAFSAETSVDGVPAYRYAVPRQVFNSSHADYAGFVRGHVGNTTFAPLPDGLVAMPCIPGRRYDTTINAAFSAPHFATADRSVRQSVVGMRPDAAGMDNIGYWDVQSTVGYPVAMLLNQQINIPVERNESLLMLRNLPATVYQPFVWIQETVHVDEATAGTMRTYVVLLPALARTLLLVFAALFLLAATLPPLIEPLKRVILRRRHGSNSDSEQESLVSESTEGKVELVARF